MKISIELAAARFSRRQALEEPQQSNLDSIVLDHTTHNGCHSRVREALMCGADPNAVGKDGDTALTRAVRNRHRPCVVELLSGWADPLQPNAKGETALTIALELGSLGTATTIKSYITGDISQEMIAAAISAAQRAEDDQGHRIKRSLRWVNSHLLKPAL